VGLILDSSVAIAAERRGDTVQTFLQHAIDAASDQEAARSAVGVVELIHGIHRADTAERRARREGFVEELLSAVVVYPLRLSRRRQDTAERADILASRSLTPSTISGAIW
jgi:predicted nucleic acid-binding protein